jgi:hypothetical protein
MQCCTFEPRSRHLSSRCSKSGWITRRRFENISSSDQAFVEKPLTSVDAALWRACHPATTTSACTLTLCHPRLFSTAVAQLRETRSRPARSKRNNSLGRALHPEVMYTLFDACTGTSGGPDIPTKTPRANFRCIFRGFSSRPSAGAPQ